MTNITNVVRESLRKQDPMYKYLEGENKRKEKIIADLSNMRELLVREIEKRITPLPPIYTIKPIQPKQYTKKRSSVILEFGDVHIGELVKGDDVANLSVYNFSIFIKYIKKLAEDVVAHVQEYSSKKSLGVLNINALGDICTGENIFPGQGRKIDLDLIDQVTQGSEAIIKHFILPVMASLPKDCKMIWRCVAGNHGRGSSKKGEMSYRSNWDYVLYRLMSERLKNIGNVEFIISESNMMVFRLPEAPNWTHLIMHGNEVRGWMGVPYYGLERTHTRIVQLFNLMIHFMHCGHFHNSFNVDVPYGERIINGSFMGASEFSVHKMQTASQPSQLLMGVNNEEGITWKRKITLAKLNKLTPDNRGLYTPYVKNGIREKCTSKGGEGNGQ